MTCFSRNDQSYESSHLKNQIAKICMKEFWRTLRQTWIRLGVHLWTLTGKSRWLQGGVLNRISFLLHTS